MSLVQRVTMTVGVTVALVICYLVAQASFQEVSTQPAEGEAAVEPSFPSPERPEFAPGKIIVAIEEDATQADLEEVNDRNDARTEEDLPRSDVSVVDLPRDLSVREAIERYEASPDVEYAEPDFLLQPAQAVSANDPNYPRMYGLNNTGQTGGSADADVDAPEAWSATAGDPGNVVAVIDEGVDTSHPDLRNNLWTNTDEVAGNGLDDDRNGYVDDVSGYDFANNDASVYDPDPVGGGGDEHGTHVAGTIAAEGNNNLGVVGVNWRARIMPLKFLGTNGGYTSDAVEAINYAVANGATISNNSWGGGGYSQALRDAIARADTAGHLFVAAAGNGGADGVGDDNDATPSYPASYDLPNIVSVAATDGRDALAGFSNFGAQSVDLAAPGVGILSTLPNDAYGYFSGTSMATPHVTGVAALIKARDPSADDARIKGQILQSVDGKGNLTGKMATGGRLNAARALPTGGGDQAAPGPAPSPQPAPAPSPAPAPADTTRPSISAVGPARTRDRTPAITATVRDDRTNLRKASMRFYVDNRLKGTFAYDASTDRLRYTSTRLSYGRHTAKVVATDAAGNVGVRTWAFRVVR